MSFTNNFKPDRTPGPIGGNPTNGLCEKVVLQATKVFDSGISQQQLENVTVTIDNITPSTTPTAPYTFLSASSVTSTGVVTDLKVTPLQNGLSRVTCNVVAPVEVLFTDCTSTTYSGTGSVTIAKDVVMKVPSGSLMPYEVLASVNLVSNEGQWSENDDFVISFCCTTIMKIAMDVDILLPSYGYACIPASQNYQEEVCEGLFDLPLYPTTTRCCR